VAAGRIIKSQGGMFMQNELEELYNMLVSETDVMKNVDEHIEQQIEHELQQFQELATWGDYECERDKYMAVAEVAKKESFVAGFNYAVRLLEGTHNP
jgi:beta-galactosidase/beta-glucuronidase